MASPNMFSGRPLCTIPETRIPPVMHYSTLISPPLTKHSAVIVRCTQDGYSVTGSSKSIKSDSSSKININNAGKTSTPADHKNFNYAAALRLSELPLATPSGEPAQGFVRQAESTIERMVVFMEFPWSHHKTPLGLSMLNKSCLPVQSYCPLGGCIFVEIPPAMLSPSSEEQSVLPAWG
eukprot:Gb_39153 [translate_table: standard]